MSNPAIDRQNQQLAIAKQTIRQYSGELVSALPSHLQEKGGGWLSSAMAALRKNDTLLQYANQNPASLIEALSEAAQLGLRPGSDEYYLTPKAGKVLGVEGYQGKVERMYRAGAVSSVIVEVVYSGDKFEYKLGVHDKPRHEVDWFGADRGKLIGAYAYAIMKDGGAVSKVVIVNQARIDRAMEASATAGKGFSPWKSDEAAMWLKTAAHDLEKWVPTSSEFIREQIRAKQDVASEAPGPAAPAPTPEAPAPAAPPASAPAEPTEEYPNNEFEDLGERPPPEFSNNPAEEAQATAQADATAMSSAAQQRMIGALLSKQGHPTLETKIVFLRQQFQREDINDLADLTKKEAMTAITNLQAAENPGS